MLKIAVIIAVFVAASLGDITVNKRLSPLPPLPPQYGNPHSMLLTAYRMCGGSTGISHLKLDTKIDCIAMYQKISAVLQYHLLSRMPKPPGPRPPTPPTPTINFRCDFENSACGFNSSGSSNQFSWRRHKGSTSSVSTGPSSDHTKGTGYYMYTEASSSGTSANLTSPSSFNLRARTRLCLKFYYHMYGASMGSLSVYVRSRYSAYRLFYKSGNQGNYWKAASASYTLPYTSSYKLSFEARKGSSYTGDIAIDDISLTQCPPITVG